MAPRRSNSARRDAKPILLALFSFLLLAGAGERTARAAFGHITLVGHLSLPTAHRISNVWGYYDAKAHKEYALVGDIGGGFYIVDVTNPALPVLVTKVTGAPGQDLKPFGHYVYSCDGNATGGRDARITDISNPASPVVLPGGFNSCHTITMSPRGYMYTEYVGVTIYDLADPARPDSLFHIANFGHDCTWRHDRLYDFNWTTLNIWDVTHPWQPVLVGSNDDPTILSYHSGDESNDGRYLYSCDELAITPTPDIVVFDISNPAQPGRVTDINDPTSRVHQLYVSGDLMFVAYYTAGFKVFDITNPAAPVLADSYDTSAYQTETEPDAYNGAYNAYPYAPSGIIYVSDHPNGLYLFSVEGHGPVTAVGGDEPGRGLALAQNYPNPFNPSTTISFQLATRERARLAVYDVQGARVRTLADGEFSAGAHSVAWNGADDRGHPVSSGVYYYRLDAGASSATRRMVLLK